MKRCSSIWLVKTALACVFSLVGCASVPVELGGDLWSYARGKKKIEKFPVQFESGNEVSGLGSQTPLPSESGKLVVFVDDDALWFLDAKSLRREKVVEKTDGLDSLINSWSPRDEALLYYLNRAGGGGNGDTEPADVLDAQGFWLLDRTTGPRQLAFAGGFLGWLSRDTALVVGPDGGEPRRAIMKQQLDRPASLVGTANGFVGYARVSWQTERVVLFIEHDDGSSEIADFSLDDGSSTTLYTGEPGQLGALSLSRRGSLAFVRREGMEYQLATEGAASASCSSRPSISWVNDTLVAMSCGEDVRVINDRNGKVVATGASTAQPN